MQIRMLSLLCNVEFTDTMADNEPIRSHPAYAQLLANKHVEVLATSQFFAQLVDKLVSASTGSVIEINEADEVDAVCVAIASLQAFVQANWLGPAPAEPCKLPAALAALQEAEAEKEADNRVFNLTAHFKLNSTVIARLCFQNKT
jgi:hypothetical protein